MDALDADIKSLKKAARQNVGPEIINRIQQIIDTGLIELKDDFKIYWNNDPIAKLTAGSDYLKPKIDLIIDEMIENDERNKLNKYLNKWINKKIESELSSLIELKNIKSIGWAANDDYGSTYVTILDTKNKKFKKYER